MVAEDDLVQPARLAEHLHPMNSNRWIVGFLSLLALWSAGFVLLCLHAPWIERSTYGNEYVVWYWLWNPTLGEAHSPLHLNMPILAAELLAWTVPFFALAMGFYVVRKGQDPRP